MIECTIDTHILADVLMQYSTGQPNLRLNKSEFLTHNILNKINLCIESDGFKGVVVASSFAFIEIVNQFEVVSKAYFNLPKLIAMLTQPPNWLIIEPFNLSTISFLIYVPKYNLNGDNIELADAIHLATAMQRGPNTFLATHDKVLSRLNYNNLKINHLI